MYRKLLSEIRGRLTSPDWLWVSLLALMVGIVYLPPLIAGQSLSILSQIPLIDSAFDSSTIPNRLSVQYDWSIFLHNWPCQKIVARLVHLFQIPLWNVYQGCGGSLAGNIGSAPFSLKDWLAPIGNEPAYSYRLVFQIFASSLAMGGIAALLGWSFFSRLWLALFWAIAPLHLYQFELGTSSWIFPPSLLLVLWTLARRDTFSLYIAGCGLSIILLSSHPEVSFCAIAGGSILAFVLLLSGENPATASTTLKRLFLLGVLVFLLTAFTLVPFSEWFGRAYLYKSSAPTPWAFEIAALMICFVKPIGGQMSPYLGAFGCFLFFCGSFLETRTRARSSLLLAAFSLFTVIIVRPWPLDKLLSAGPISYLYPSYALPLLFLTALLICGRGVSTITSHNCSWKSLGLPLAVSATISAVTIWLSDDLIGQGLKYPVLIGDPSFWLSAPVSSSSQLQIIGVSSLAAFAILILNSKLDASVRTLIFHCLILAVSLYCNLTTSGWRLCEYPSSDLECPAIIRPLVDKNFRLLSIGESLLAPNIPSAFRVKDLRHFDALLPLRFIDFLEVCGCRTKNTFWREFSPVLDWRLNLASVTHIVSRSPIFDASNSQCLFSAKQNLVVLNGARLKLKTVYVSDNRKAIAAIFETLIYKPAEKRNRIRLTSSPELSSANSSSNTWQELGMVDQVCVIHESKTSVAAGEKLYLEVSDNTEPLKPTVTLEVATIRALPLAEGKRFLLEETDLTGIKRYRNNQAYPPAYFADTVRYAKSRSEAVDQLKKLSPLSGLAIVETEGMATETEIKSSSTDELRLVEESPTKLTFQSNANGSRWLVVTDSYDPDWSVRIDKVAVHCLPTNINFRGVLVGPGSHQIEFSYEPKTFWLFFTIAVSIHIGFWIKFARSVLTKKVMVRTQN